MKTRVLPLVMAIVILLSSCSGGSYTEYEFMMDTNCSITVYSRADRDAVAPVFARLRELDRALDRFNASGDVARVNLSAGQSPVEVSPEVFGLISRAKELCEMTAGAFNPLLGAVSDLWGFDRAEHESVPSQTEIAGLLEACDISNLVLDADSCSVYIADERARLDLGAIAKGYAGQVASQLLAELGVERAIVNLGGNVTVLGSREDGRPWRVGIQNPEADEGGYFTTVDCSDTSVVTSGAYQRYFDLDGVRYHHILDPSTGYPAESDISSVTIISPDGALADALSTACFVLGSRNAEELCRRCGVQALILPTSGEIIRLEQ